MNGVDQLLRDWGALGVDVAIAPSGHTPDLESVILRTAALMPDASRLFPIGFSWLSSYQTLVARHRLARMADEIAGREHLAALGLLLDAVRHDTGSRHLSLALGRCKPLPSRVALLRSERGADYRPIVEQEACSLSRKWGLLAPMPVLKTDAIRPIDWVLKANPSLRVRALLGGNLAASILTAIAAEPDSGASESALARACGATRKAIRDSLDYLEFCGLVDRSRDRSGTIIQPRRRYEFTMAS